MKVMISQPMNGKPEEQIKEERKELVKAIETSGDEVIDTVFTQEAPKDCDAAIYYLSKSIEAIGKADTVIFMKGWEKARGCVIEHLVAVKYDKEIVYCN